MTAHGRVADALEVAGVTADAEGARRSSPRWSGWARPRWDGDGSRGPARGVIGAARGRGSGRAAARAARPSSSGSRSRSRRGGVLARGTVRLARDAPVAAEVEVRGVELA